MTFKDNLRIKNLSTLAPPIPYTGNVFHHSALRSHSLTQEHAGHTSHTNRGKNRTEVISHTNQLKGASFSAHSVLQMTNTQSVFVEQLMLLLGNPLLVNKALILGAKHKQISQPKSLKYF